MEMTEFAFRIKQHRTGVIFFARDLHCRQLIHRERIRSEP